MPSAPVRPTVDALLERSDRDFERAVKDALDFGKLDPALVEAYTRRLPNRVTLVAMANVILDSPLEEVGARRATVAALAAVPHHATSILAMMPTLFEDWPRPETVSESADGPPHARTFEVTLRLSGLQTTPEVRTATARGRSRREAEQRAGVRLLAQVAEVEEPAFDEPVAVKAPPPAEVKLPRVFQNGDPITLLFNHAAQRRKKRPYFQHRKDGDLLEATCKFDGRSTVGRAVAKKDAEREAAKLMLAALSAPVSAEPAPAPSAS